MTDQEKHRRQDPPPHAPAAAPPDPWPAPTRGAENPVRATVRIPGSKSLTNRHLLLAALADGPGTLRGALDSRDSRLMIASLESLGARFERGEGSYLRVTPLPSQPSSHDAAPAAPVRIETGLAGTVMRFVPPVAALLRRPAAFDGDPGARSRPMGPLLDALEQLGCRLDFPAAEAGFETGSGTGDAAPRRGLPFAQSAPEPADLAGTPRLVIDSSGSSQFLSALLLAGCLAPDGLIVEHRGGPLPSLPHIEMTVQTLREVGIRVEGLTEASWKVPPGRPLARDVVVEPDLSNAGPFLAAAVLTTGTVRIPDWPEQTTQGGDHWRGILPRFGAEVRREGADLIVTGPPSGQALPGIDVDLSAAGELAPTVAALAAVADGPSRLTGIGHLRGHETDRLAALVAEIRRLGGQAEELADGLAITGRVTRGGLMHTYEDHRMATAAAVIGLRQPGVLVQNVATTAKTLPGFDRMWERMLAGEPA